MPLTDQERTKVAQQWLQAVNNADLDTIEHLVAYDVVDHSGLAAGHGTGCDGYKKLVAELHNTFPGYSSTLDGIEVNGDLVTIRHTGRADYPPAVAPLMGTAAQNPQLRTMEFKVASTVRIDDQGKITEHWATEGPFGQRGTPDATPTPGRPALPTGTPELNMAFMRKFLDNVIDSNSAARAQLYFAENFVNHDPIPGEKPGLDGIIQFLNSIFGSFTDFHTELPQQLAEDDLVAGLWSQEFVNTGPYLNFPATGRKIKIGGITITRVRDGKMIEQWEARDALSLVTQMGVPSPFGKLDGTTDDADSAVVEANRELAREYFYGAWGAGRVDEVDTLFAPHFENGSLTSGQRPGVDGIKQEITAFRGAFPDCSVSVDLQLATADRVVTRYTLRGTHRGAFRGVPATGTRVEVTGIAIHGVADGRITGYWGYFDEMTLALQLGLVQLPGQPPGPPGQPGQPGTGDTPPW